LCKDRAAAAQQEQQQQDDLPLSREGIAAKAREALAVKVVSVIEARRHLSDSSVGMGLLEMGAGARLQTEPWRSLMRALKSSGVGGRSHPRTIAYRQKLIDFARKELKMPPQWAPQVLEAILLKQDRVRLSERRMAVASLVYNSSRLIWASFVAWLRSQLEQKSLEGAPCHAVLAGR
jgi:hypothetical protein